MSPCRTCENKTCPPACKAFLEWFVSEDKEEKE